MIKPQVIVLAGGVGSRFWPISQIEKPKQFLDFFNTGKTLLQTTFERFEQSFGAENIWVITHERYATEVKDQLKNLNLEQLLLEPIQKNTAASIAYATYQIAKKNPDTVLIISPADHFILKPKELERHLQTGCQFMNHKTGILTLGIDPTRADTNYGYIQADTTSYEIENISKVLSFVEKPPLEKAKTMLLQGDYYWNSGIFISNLRSLINIFSKHAPIYHKNLKQEHQSIQEIFTQFPDLSFDYAVMEKAEEIYILRATIGWSDLGTWNSIYHHSEKDKNENAIQGKNIFVYDAHRNFIKVPEKKYLILQGLEDYTVVDTEKALLICKREQEQEIFHLFKIIQQQNS